MIYFVYFFMLFLSSFRYVATQKNNKLIINFFLYSLSFILAFNYKMGSDWLNYQKYYDLQISQYSFQNIIFNNPFQQEKGYMFLNLLGNKLGLNYEIFMGLLISFCIINVFKLGIQKSKNKFIFIFVIFIQYILIASLEPTIRQFMAVTILTFGYKYIEEKALIKYLLVVLIAIQFHTSAIIGIIFYLLDRIKINKKRVFVLLILTLILINTLPDILNLLSTLVSSKHLQKYLNYFNSIVYGASRQRSIKGNIFIYVATLLYLYIVFFSYDNYKSKKNYIKNVALIYIICNYFQSRLPILYRVQEYFVVSFAITISYCTEVTFFGKRIISYKNTFKYIIITIIYALFGFIFIQKVYKSDLDKLRYSNYKNYFIEMLKGKTTNSFKDKKEEYEKEIEKLVNNEREKIYKELGKK